MRLSETEITSILAVEDKKKKLQDVRDTKNALRDRRELMEEVEKAKAKLPTQLTDIPNQDDVASIHEEIDRDIQARLNKLNFINPRLSKLIHLTSHQLVLIGARTGKGKSTAVANIAYSLIGQGKRVLIISNEEKRSDVIVRIACLHAGLSFYNYNHSRFTQDQLDALKASVSELTTNLKVVDLDYRSNPAFVTSIDGLKSILVESVGHYDAVIIDYYQKVSQDTRLPGRSLNDIQNDFALTVDQLKNKFDGPIIIFAQMHPSSDQKKDFQEQLKGRRTIMDVSTIVCELIANKKEYLTLFICHKDRHFGNDGCRVTVGFDRDLCTYIPDPESDHAFRMKVGGWTADRVLDGLSTDDEPSEKSS